MKVFNQQEPLVFLHIFKTAGSTLTNILRKWYNPEKRFIKHNVYTNVAPEARKETCTEETINKLAQINIPNPVFCGHFDQTAYKFPSQCNQFITILRDPFEQMVSAYYFSKTKQPNLINLKYSSVEEYVMKFPYRYNLSNSFTKEKITIDNFETVINKYFIAVGSLKNFSKTLDVFENVLGKKNADRNLHVNKNSTQPNEYLIPEHCREKHREKYSLEYAIYDYVNEYYNY